MPSRKRFLISSIALAAISLSASGCGPGFPIMTKEQESLVMNVDNLVKENESLKARVLKLEGGGGGLEELRGEMLNIRQSIADTNSSIENLRRETDSFRGKMDETSHKDEVNKKYLNNFFANLDNRMAAIENSAKDASARIDTLKASVEAGEKKSAETRESLLSLEKKVSSIEAKPAPATQAPEPAAKAQEDPEALYSKGYKEVLDKDYSKATASFVAFLSAYPEHKLAQNAQYWIAEIYYAEGDWEKAILEFDKVIKKYPKGDKVAGSLLKQAFAFEKIGSRKEARVLLNEVVNRFPKSPEAGLARKRLDTIK